MVCLFFLQRVSVLIVMLCIFIIFTFVFIDWAVPLLRIVFRLNFWLISVIYVLAFLI